MQLGHSLGFDYQPFSAKSSTSLLSMQAKRAVQIYLESQNVLVEDLNFFCSSLVMGFVCFRTDFSLVGVCILSILHRKEKKKREIKKGLIIEVLASRMAALNRGFFQ